MLKRGSGSPQVKNVLSNSVFSHTNSAKKKTIQFHHFRSPTQYRIFAKENFDHILLAIHFE